MKRRPRSTLTPRPTLDGRPLISPLAKALFDTAKKVCAGIPPHEGATKRRFIARVIRFARFEERMKRGECPCCGVRRRRRSAINGR